MTEGKPGNSDWIIVPDMTSRIPFELFADVQEPQSIALSRNGELIIYSIHAKARPAEHVRSSLWIAEVGRAGSAKQLTRGNFNDHDPSFSPDGKTVAFLSDRAKAGKSSDLYILPLNGGEALQLTPSQYEKGIAGYKFNPNGKSIAYLKPAEDPEDRKQKTKDKDDTIVSGEKWDFNKIHNISLDTKEVEVLDATDLHVSQFDWSPDGTEIVFTTSPSSEINVTFSGSSEIYSIRPADGKKYHILSNQATVNSLCWCDDGLRWYQNFHEDELCSAHAIFGAKATNKSKIVYLSQGKTDCALSLKKCAGKPIVQIIHGMTERLQEVESSDFLLQGRCRYQAWDIAFVGAETTVAVVKGSSDQPLEVYSIVKGKECQLSNHGEELASRNFGTTKIFEYENEDGTPMDGFYTIPTTLQAEFDAKRPLPTVVIAHGGPYGSSNDNFFVDMFAPAFYMTQGYLVLVVNYRGGQGHGSDYAMTVAGNPAASYQDIAWLVKKGIDEGNIDKERVAMTGWSQGGYLSFLSVTRDDDFHFAASIPGAGVTDWTTMGMTSDLPAFECALAGGSPWLANITWIGDRKSSPIYHMQDIKTPMLLLHGEVDPRVPVSQAVSFHRGMRARNLPCELAIYPRENHGFPDGFERAHYVDMSNRIAKFLEKYIGQGSYRN